MNCKQCGKPLVRYIMLTDTGSDTCSLCYVCNTTKMVELNAQNKRIMDSRLETLQVPKRYWDAEATTNSMSTADANSLNSFTKGAYFIGESGAGKTYQMIGWLKKAIYTGVTVKYVDWSDVMCQLRGDAKGYMELKESLTAAPVMFIDDFSLGNAYTEEYAYNFLNTIYKKGAVPFFTSEELPHVSKFAMRISEMTIQFNIQT